MKAAKALKEKGETPEELLQSIKENEAAVAEAQRVVDAWKAIVGEKSRREEAAKAEAERIATEKAEAERKAAEERERAEAEEKTRIEAKKKEAERIAAEKAEEARVEAERKAEEERIAKQKAEEKTEEAESDKEEKKRKAEAEKPKQKPLTEAERKDAEEVAGALGYRVEWVDTMEENGTIDADKKVIRIAKDAENPLVQVLGHEVAHGVKQMDGGKFKALQKAAMEVVGEKEWNERIEKKRKLNAYAEGKLAEEVTCDIVGEALNDKDALKRLAESLRGERGILARLRDAVAKMVEYFKNRGDKEGVRRMKAADKLLAEFESALKDGDGVNESAREADVPTDNVGNIDFSHRTYHDHKDDDGNEHRGTRGKIIEYLNNVGMKKSDIGKFVDNMDYWYDLTGKVASLVDKDGHFDFPAFHEWSQTSPLYKKYEGNIVRAVSTLVSNGEYPLNFELSTDCIKREAFTQILNEMVDLGGAIWKNLTPAKIQELRTLQQSYGIQVACPLCFVEGKRLNIMKWATGVTDKWNEAVRRVVGDEATPFGFGKGTYVPATPYNERSTPQEVTDQINEVARIVGSREGALPKDLARMQENTKAMEALLQQYYEDYVAKHGSAEGFSLSEAQLGELAKLRGKGASNVVDRMVDIIATHPELQHTLDVSDLVGSKGLMAIRGQSGDGFAKMYSLIVCANGTGTPKIVQDAQPYSGEILDVRQSKFDKAAEIGGARLFSFSDFDLTKTFDIMQIMWDCAARKAKVQSYSKEIPYILMFGKSGVKINMSMLPEARPSDGLVQEYKEAKGSARKYVLEKIRENAGLDMEGGHIVGIQLSDSHSVSKEFAESIYHNPDYNANCGAIMVGISVNHALYAMGQDYIRQVIPFHLSGMPISARRATDCQYYRDFTSEQNTGIIVNGRRVKQFDGGGKPIHNKDVPSDFDFYEGENEKGWDMRQRCRDYVKWCGENGLVPRFEWAVNSDNYKAWCKKKGYQPNQEIVDMMDAHTTDGVYDEYYKVITDFTAYKPIFDKDGNTIGEEPAPHRPVTGDFSMDDKTLGMVLGVDSEGRKVDDNSMLANRENTIKNADANKKEIAEKALLILNGKAKVEDLVRKGGEQFDNNSDSDKFFESSNEGIDRSVREGKKDDKTLYGVHNISEDKLRKAMKLGGLANPSMAVVDKDKGTHEGFGAISLIAPSSLVDKQTGRTAGSWITDAYTQRYPFVERVMSDKGYKKFKSWVDGLDFAEKEKKEIMRQATDAMESDNDLAWELMYLREKGVDVKGYTSEVDYPWEKIVEEYPSVEGIIKAMDHNAELKETVTKLAKVEITVPIYKAVSADVRRRFKEETGENASPLNPIIRKRTNDIYNRDYAPKLLDENGMPKASDVRKVIGQMVEKYNATKKVDFNKSKLKASTYVHNNGLYADYLKWQEGKLEEFGTQGRIFRGYKNDGTRKYVPETLSNVSKVMKEKSQGQTNGSEYTSFGSFIAKLAPRVDSKAEMRGSKSRLDADEAKQEFYEKWESTYYDLAKELYSDVFSGEARLHDIVLQSDPKRYAKKEYGITLSPSFLKRLEALKKAIREDLKSAYFETKFERPVMLNEFAAAVVPKGIGDDVRKGLEDAGLVLYEYDPAKKGDRERAANEASASDGIRFNRSEKTELTAEERELRDNLVERMRKGGLDVVTDSEEMQRVIDTENERTRESRKRRSAVAEERLRVGNTIDEAMAAATHLTKEEARAMRREWERKFKEETKELYGRVLSGNFDDVTLRLIDEFIDKSTPNNPYGRPLSKRLPPRVGQKMRGGERTGSIDALFSRISESAVGKDGKALPRAERERAIEEKKKELLKKWAIATGNWHTDIADFTDQREPIGSGTDSDVYLGKDGKSVIKVSKGKPYGKRFRPDVDNVALFNSVFRNSAYTIVGYGEIDGKFVRFLKQPIVDFTSSTPLTEGERVAYMEKLGFKPINNENTAFSNGEIIASDLQKSNIVKDKQGNVRVIDADMKLHTKDFGGKFSYPDAETDTRTDGVQRFLRTADGEVYGLVKDGRIYLDPKVATAETAVHEYTHLWGDMLRRKDSEQWSHTVKELKNSVLWEEVKESYPELKTDDEIADEVLSTFSGRRGAERLREEARRVAEGDGGVFTKAKAIETLERVKEAIARFWEGVARMFGINRYRSAEELADMAMRDLLDSKNPMKDESGMRKRGEVGDEGVKSLKGEEAMVALDNIFEDKKTENMPQKVSSLVKFMELFRKPVRTFLGEVVNVKEEVYNKIIREKRTSISGAVLPTLENADFAIRDTDGSTLYIKRFKSENNDNVYNIAVVNKYGEVEDYVSSVHIKSDNNLRNKITKGAELLLPQERITDGILPRNNPTPTANVTNISELSKPRYSRKPGESIFDYASRVSEDVDRSVRERVSARDEYEKKVKSKGFQTKEALQNSMLGLQEFMYAIDHASGNKRYIEDIPDFENPILGENRLSSVNKEEMHQVAKTQFKPLMSAVAKLSGNGKESGELYDYMFAKHGLERDAVMRQREAQKEFDKYQKANPKGTKTIGDFVASLEGKDYAGLTALTAEDGRVKSIQSQIDAIDEQMKATDDQLLLHYLGGQKKRLKVDLLNAARDAADDIRKTFENNPSHDRSDINELWSRVNEVNGNTLRKLYESGLLTKEAYNDISSMYTNYIPMRGFDQTTSADAYAYLTHGDSAFNAPIKTAKGRSSKADNPIAYMQAMAESAIMQGNRNVLVKQKMLNFVRNHPSDLASVSDVWLQYDSVADEWKPVFPDNIGANDSASVVAKKMEAFEDKMKQMAEKHPDLVQRSNEAPDIPYKVVEKGQLNEHQVLVKQNGKSYIITVNGSPRAAQAANGLTNPDTDLTGAVGKVFEGAEALNRQLSSLYTTLNPDFIGSNYVRDALYSNTMVYVKEGAKYGGSFNLNFAKYNPAEMANLYARYNKGSLDTSNETHRLFLEFMQNGGETGFVNLKQIEKRKSEIAKAIKRDGEISAAQIWGGLSDAIDFANRAVENSARFAAYVTSRKSGRSVVRSVYDVKEISVNFNRKGSGRNWWKDNVGTSRFYDTEIGLVEINRASVGSSLAHRYSQVKLDVITSLAEGFNNAVYFGSMQDFSRQEGVKSHYFAYPINYNENRNYVFCRAMQDANKSRLYVHEVFLADNIEKGNTLQTAASQPHRGITLYKDILANVLAANVTNDSETSKPCFSRKPGESIFDYASRVSEDVDRSVCEGR